MYRQIWVSENDKNLQKILWRFKPDDEIKEYRLKTVTYALRHKTGVIYSDRLLKKIVR